MQLSSLSRGEIESYCLQATHGSQQLALQGRGPPARCCHRGWVATPAPIRRESDLGRAPVPGPPASDRRREAPGLGGSRSSGSRAFGNPASQARAESCRGVPHVTAIERSLIPDAGEMEKMMRYSTRWPGSRRSRAGGALERAQQVGNGLISCRLVEKDGPRTDTSIRIEPACGKPNS